MLKQTRSEVYGKFRTLCLVADRKAIEQISAKARQDWNPEYYGSWHLEFKPKHGYRIEEYSRDHFPMGENYRGAAEMVRTMDFAIGVLQTFKDEQRRQHVTDKT